MTTEQLYTKVGEWYWGATCPECGEKAAHSKGDSEKPGGEQVTIGSKEKITAPRPPASPQARADASPLSEGP